MKKPLCFVMTMMLFAMSTSSHANTQKQAQINEALTKILSLIDGEEQMNLKAAAEIFDEPDLYRKTLFEQLPNSPALTAYYRFQNKDNSLESVHYQISLDMSKGYGAASSSVEFEFKDGYCPTPDDYERVVGTKAMTTQLPNSPDLITGRGSSYTAHFITTKKDKSLMMVGCRVMTYSDVKLS